MSWNWWMDPTCHRNLEKMYEQISKSNNDVKRDYDLSCKQPAYREELHIINIIVFFVKIIVLIGVFVGTWFLLDHFFPIPI